MSNYTYDTIQNLNKTNILPVFCKIFYLYIILKLLFPFNIQLFISDITNL